MTELEARKIFDMKLALCGTLGLDVRRECVGAGLPVEMVDKFIAADRALMSGGAQGAAPYIRVQADHSPAPRVTASVRLSIAENPGLVAGSGLAAEDKAAASAFIRLNREALLDHWNGVKEAPALIGVLKS